MRLVNPAYRSANQSEKKLGRGGFNQHQPGCVLKI